MGFPDPRPKFPRPPNREAQTRPPPQLPLIARQMQPVFNELWRRFELAEQANEEIRAALVEVLKRLPKEPLHDVETANP